MSNATKGKYDPGASGGGLSEADIVLQWALTGKWVAQQMGIDVFLTRDDDSDVTPVSTRDNKAELAGCNYFISLHCDAASTTSARGLTVFIDKTQEDRDRKFALTVQNALISAASNKATSRGIKLETETRVKNLAVLDFKKGPAVLLELGFITNAQDRIYMTDRNVRVRFWQNFFAAVDGVKK
jgi:N-acetylmuramoyl-L-alanine amidase